MSTNMNKTAAVIALSYAAAMGAAYAENDTISDSHALTLKVPEVAMLAVSGNLSIDATPEAPTQAGNAFSGTTSGTATLQLSSNIPATNSSSTRSITVSLAQNPNWTLKISSDQGGTATLVNSNDAGTGSAEIVTSAGTGAQTIYSGLNNSWGTIGLTYELDFDATMPSFGTQTITTTYTLTDPK